MQSFREFRERLALSSQVERDGALAVLVALALAGSVFILYLKTLAPTMLYYDPAGMYDSVMLQVKAYVLGIPNPTGYPTYMILAHLFTYLPFGDVGYRVNLASAVYGALSVFVLFFVCRLLTGRVLAALAAAFLFGVSREFWSQAVITEVYTLNALFVSLDLLALVLWYRSRRDKYLLLFAFFMGLSMTNHMTSGLVLPAAAILVVFTEPRKLTEWRLLLKGAGLYLLALTPYIYLPIRSAMNPPLDEANPDRLGNFITLVTGSNFNSRMFGIPWEKMPQRLGMYADFLANQFNPFMLVVGVFGALCLAYRREVPLLVALLFLYFGWLVYALGYNVRDVYVYFIPTYLIFCLFAAVGFGSVVDAAYEASERSPRLLRAASVVVVAVVVSVGPLVGVQNAYAQVDRSGDMHGRHIMDAVMRGVEPNSTVMHRNGVMWYMNYVTDHRPDIKVVDPFPRGSWEPVSSNWVKVAEKNLKEGRRVYILFPSGTAQKNTGLFRSAGYDLKKDKSGYFYEVVLRQRADENYPRVSSDGSEMVPQSLPA